MNGLTCGTTYTVGVRALDSAGNAPPDDHHHHHLTLRDQHVRGGRGGHAAELSAGPACACGQRQAVERLVLRGVQRHDARHHEADAVLRLELRRLHGSFNPGKERYLPSQVQVSNGTAKLVAEPLVAAVREQRLLPGSVHVQGRAWCRRRDRERATDRRYLFPFTYGYVESRMKFPGTPGILHRVLDAARRSELQLQHRDRHRRDPRRTTRHDLHDLSLQRSQHVASRRTTGLHNNGACQVKDYSSDFVRFGLDWEPTYVAWYIDGVKCGQFNGNTSTIANGPMQLILHMMVDNDWERGWGSVLSSQTLVRQLEVDYIRVYQQR